MPVFIGDVLESSGGPVLDLSTQQVRGLGIFDNISERDDIQESLRVKGYISYADSTLSVFGENFNSTWDNTINWKNVLCDRGFAVDLDIDDDGTLGVNSVGFLLGGGSDTRNLYPGDVFHIRGLHEGNVPGLIISQKYTDSDSSDFGTPISDGSYYVIQACDIVTSEFESTALENIYDLVRSGHIVPFHSGRTLVDRHTQLTESNVSSLTGDDSVASAILGGEGKILVGVKDGNERAKDFSLTVDQFISLLAIGIAEDNVSNGYGDYTSYGGVAGETFSAGDINGDGIVTVADLLILLGGLGSVPSPSFSDTVVTFGNVSGVASTADSTVQFDQERYVAEEGSRTYMHRDFALNGEAPTVTQGGATVYIVNTENSTSDLESTNSPPGDMIIFSGTESTDFDINAFGSVPANSTKLFIEEQSGTGDIFDDPSNAAFRNIILLTAAQVAEIETFKVIARVRRFSSDEGLPSISEFVIDDREVLLGTYSLGDVNNGVFAFNLTNGNQILPGEGQLNLSNLYFQQHDELIFQNTTDGSNVKAVGVQVGFRFQGQFGIQDSFNHPSHGFNNFKIRCKPHNG